METIAATPGKKIGVCISGGGARIGFAAGVLDVMTREHNISIDLAYGISAGSLCTAALCYGGPDSGVPFLIEWLKKIKKRSDVLKTQLLKMLWAQVTKRGQADGLFEMGTMRRMLENLGQEKTKTKGVVGYVRLKSAQLEYVPSDKVNREEFLDAVQASCSMPVFCQSQRVGADNCVDGGVMNVLPLKPLVQDVLKVDEVHIISLFPLPMKPTSEPLINVLQVGGRAVDLLTATILQNDYDYALRLNELVNYRLQVMNMTPGIMMNVSPRIDKWLARKRNITFFGYVPEEPICDTIDFRPEMIQKGIEKGQEMARKVLKNYPNP